MADGAIVPVIMSGGSGTRLWPLSRTGRPKQFLPLTDPLTMLQLTARRVVGHRGFAAPIVVASDAHCDVIERQLGEAGAAPAALILEPAPRNTAPAVALAALAAAPDALLLVMPSDHHIEREEDFRAAIARAAPLAREGWLMTFGIAAERPETGYGYIRRGEALGSGLFRVERFVEKPDAATARGYLAEGGYDWNGGIFLFRADTYLSELERYAPQIAAAAREAMEGATRDGLCVRPQAAAFAQSPSISIDYAVMERAGRIAVVPVDMGWSDVGSWDALYELGDKDEAGNLLSGEVVVQDSRNCLIRAEGGLVVACGVEDLIVIASGDAVLILPRGDSQRVKAAVDALKACGHPSLDGSGG